MLSKGDQLPDLELEDQNGALVSFSDFKGKPLVIYFYPKDNTSVCTAQACGFRDNYEQFQEAGAEVIGISQDSSASHKKVADKRRLPFILLSDPKKKALKAFGVPTTLFGLVPGRVTFVADSKGQIIHTFRADFSAAGHIKEALKALSN
ncbi:peroxiredoxin [Ekhidna sp.]|uniref:peroxiredoxin n=1 Tax=Ekhidna sp. TaxID=2608089 RepID=UPI003BAD8447